MNNIFDFYYQWFAIYCFYAFNSNITLNHYNGMYSEDSDNTETVVQEPTPMPLFLTVDDEPNINWALGRLIAQRGFPVHHALCGAEAIELSLNHRYSGIFVDAKLPDIEGPQLITRLRQIQASPFIILISGYFFPGDPVVEQAMQTGLIQAFISKPFMHAEILALVDRIASEAR
jgi:CheY-like chemotaxis protein